MPSSLSPESLDAALEKSLIGAPMPSGRRCLGIEVERLILHRQTRVCAPLEFCRQLIADLAADIDGRIYMDGEVINRVDGDGYSLTMEPGGQLELATEPRTSLAEIDPTMAEVRRLVESRLAGTEFHTVALGHAPVSHPDELGLLPRSRYKIMDRAMTPRGNLTRNMMRATAGFQLTYDVTDRADAGRKMALLYRLAPIMVALCANSRIIGGKDSGYASFRHHVWQHTDRTRVGVPPGCLGADTAVDGYKRFAREAILLFLRRDGELVPSPEVSLEQGVAQGVVTQDDLELHLSSLFPYVRMRNYLEVRYLDSVEWPLARSVLAMLSGLIYCSIATAKAEALTASTALADPAALDAVHQAAARDGLDAVLPDGRGFRDVARELLSYSTATLGGASCRWADRADLAAVERRIA